MLDSKLISRLVKLIGASGDKLVLPDVETGKAVVIMDLDAYEALLGTGKQGSDDVGMPGNREAEEQIDNHVLPPDMPGVRQAPATDFESVMAPVDEPVVAPAPAPVIDVPKKPLQIAKNEQGSSPEMSGQNGRSEGLTTPENQAKLHHDIGGWKNAQELERVQELRSAVGEMPPVDLGDALDEEEQFYLEPIE